MWTYRQQPKKLFSSKKRLEYHAEIELNHSLHNRNTIAFVGSGVTIPYGRCTWSELCLMLINFVDKKSVNILGVTNSNSDSLLGIDQFEARHLHGSLYNLLGKEIKRDSEGKIITPTEPLNLDIGDKFRPNQHVLELCSQLCNALGEPTALKTETARIFSATPKEMFCFRLQVMGKPGSLILNLWNKAEEKSKIKGFNNTQLFREISKNFNINPNDIKLTREQIEVSTWKILSSAIRYKYNRNKIKEYLSFIIYILDQTQGKTIEQGEWPDPLKVITNELGIKHFITLNYDKDIETHFIQNYGYQDSEVSSDAKVNPSPIPERIVRSHNGYGSLMKSVTLNDGMVGTLVDFSVTTKETESYVFHLHGRADIADDLILTERDYQQRYVRSSEIRRSFYEGLTALFGGNDILFLGIGMSEADLLQPLRQFVSEAKNINHQQDRIISILQEKKNAAETELQSLELITQYGVKAIFYKNQNESNIEHKPQIYAPITKIFKTCKLRIFKNKLALDKQITLMINSRLKAKDQGNAFVEKLSEIAVNQKNWLKEVQAKPGQRHAIFRNWPDKNCSKSRIWIRQHIDHVKDGNTSFEDYDPAHFSNLTNVLKANANSSARRIYRFSGYQGIGKGAFVHALQRACKEKNGSLREIKYTGAFFADARFTNEFNSVISALSRFLAGSLAKLKAKSTGEIKEIENEAMDRNFIQKALGINIGSGRTTILRSYLKALANEVANNGVEHDERGKRILICLSGLDRLTNDKGYAYNALHRDFFRALCEKTSKNSPIDLILIAGRPDAPIRYLSKCVKKGNNPRPRINNQKAKLEPWIPISRTSTTDRNWLPGAVFSLDSNHKVDIDHTIGILATGSESIDSPSLLQLLDDNVAAHYWLRSLFSKLAVVRRSKLPATLNMEKAKLTIEGYLKNIASELEHAATHRQMEGVIETIFKICQREETSQEHLDPNLFQVILRHLALFSLPIQRSILANCPQIKKFIRHKSPLLNTEAQISEELEKYLTTLRELGLIIKIHSGNTDSKPLPSKSYEQDLKEDCRYSLHSFMREHLAKMMSFHAYHHGEYSFFDVDLYPAQPIDLPSPGPDDFEHIGRILQSLIKKTRWDIERWEEIQKSSSNVKEKSKEYISKLDSIHSISRRIRAAVNLVSSAFSIGVISRLEFINDEMANICEQAKPFDCYAGWLRDLQNLSIALEQKNDHSLNGLQDPLYQTENVWLYNERGVVALIQGRIWEALDHFDLALSCLQGDPWLEKDGDINQAPMSSLRRVELNRAIALLESGDAIKAKSIFRKLHNWGSSKKRNRNSITAMLAGGYIGLCLHLEGQVEPAKSYYTKVLSALKSKDDRFLRTSAIFNMHMGTLYGSTNNLKKSSQYIRMAKDISASSRQMDILHQACLSEARLLLRYPDKSQIDNAFKLLRAAEDYAERMGVQKIQAHANLVRGQILLELGQHADSGQTLTSAIAISNKYGLTIRKIQALEVYGKLLETRDADKELIKDVKQAAKKLAEQCGYLIQSTQFK